MITRRLVVNLVVFFVVSFGLVAYGIVNLLGNPLESSTTLTTQFANASGLYPGFEVELNGVPVGTVSSTALTKTGTRVVMTIDPGTSVPSDVRSSVQIANDLGEQVVNLVPTRGGPAPALASGATVPAARDDVPADVGQVVATATRLLQAIPAGNLNKLIGEMATALRGNAGNLRTLISAGTTFSKEFVAYQQQFTELLANAPPALDAVTAVAPQLRQDLANTAALVQVLAQNKSGLHNLLTQGSSAFGAVDQLVANQSANLGCLLHDSAGILSNLAQPTNLTNLSQGLTFNQYFFGAVDNIAVARAGQADDEQQPARPQPDLPAHPPHHPARPQRARHVVRPDPDDPRRLPGRRLHHGVRVGRRCGRPARFHPGRRRSGRGAHRPGGRRRTAVRHHRPLDQHRLPGPRPQRRPPARPRPGRGACPRPGLGRAPRSPPHPPPRLTPPHAASPRLRHAHFTDTTSAKDRQETSSPSLSTWNGGTDEHHDTVRHRNRHRHRDAAN